MKRTITLLMLIMAAGLILAACGGGEPANHLEAIRQEGKMVVGTSADYPPFEYVDDAGEFAGFDMDLIREIGRRMEVEVEIVDMPFDSLIAAVQEEKLDASIAAFTSTEERDQVVDFTDPYYWNEDGFMVAEDFTGEITTAEDAAAYIVGVQTGTTAEAWAVENLVDTGLMPDENLLRYERMDQAALDVKAGRIDILFNDYLPLLELAKEVEGVKIVFHDAISAGPVNIVVPEGDDALREEFNRIIAELEADGTLEELERTHISGE